MKKLGIIGMAFAMAGNVLGAGFVSGQELWQYFGVFGKKGILGMVFSFLLLFLLSAMILHYSYREGIDDAGVLVFRGERPVLRELTGAITVFFMFSTYVVMVAGAGALLFQTFGIPAYIGNAAICILVFFATISGVSGFLRVFSIFVPVLLLFVFGLCIYSFPEVSEQSFLQIKGAGDNPMLSNWVLAAFNNATYNAGCLIGVFPVMAARVKNKKTIYLGTFLGIVLLTVISAIILLMIFSDVGAADFSLPMVAYATGINKGAGLAFSLLILISMFATSLANSVAIAYYARIKLKALKSKRGNILGILLISLFCFLGSLFGFSSLVSVVYPVTGYISLVFIVMIGINFISAKRRDNKKSE